jgi:hypothetical protein
VFWNQTFDDCWRLDNKSMKDWHLSTTSMPVTHKLFGTLLSQNCHISTVILLLVHMSLFEEQNLYTK